MMGVVICPICGTENPVDATHCTNCRINLKWALKNLTKSSASGGRQASTVRAQGGNHRPVRAADSAFGERPGCVTLYATLLFIGAGLTAITGATSLSGLIAGYFGNLGRGVIQGAGILAIASLEFLLAKGLWQLKNWARITVIVIYSLVMFWVLFAPLFSACSSVPVPLMFQPGIFRSS